MLHNEARKLLLEAWDKTHNASEIAKYFSVNESTVYRLVERRDQTGSYETRTNLRGRKPVLSEEQRQAIIQLVREEPDITINEIIERLHLNVCDETVRRVLIKEGYTYKKEVTPCQRTGASPMFRTEESIGTRVLVVTKLRTLCFLMKAVSTPI